MLKIRELNTFYGHIHALKGISMDIREGEIVSLIGSNGAGKSTTLGSIVGLVQPQSGKIEFKGQDITNMPPHNIVKLGVSLSPEGREVFPALTVQENLRLGAYISNNKANIEEAFTRVYDLFPMVKERLDRQRVRFPEANNRCLQ